MPRHMLTAFALALGQIGDRTVLRILARSIVLSLALFAVLGVAGWWGIDWLLQHAGLDDGRFVGAEGVRGTLALAATLIGGWLLWRVIALAALQFHADAVVEAVEARYYPDALDRAQPLGTRQELVVGLRGAARAILYNLIALPFALALLVTGLGTAIVFWAVNALLLGRELTEMVALRHRDAFGAALPLAPVAQFLLGGVVAALFFIPVANLIAPMIGAAMATHLIHRKGALTRAS